MQSASLLCHRPGEKSGGSDTRVTGQWADRFTATRAGQRWHSHRTRPLGLTKNGADLHPKPSVRRTGWGRGSPQKRKGRSGFSKEVRSRVEAGARGVPARRKVVQWERFANPPPPPYPRARTPRRPLWSHTGFPHPYSPLPRSRSQDKRQSALLVSQATRQPYRDPVSCQIPSGEPRRCKYGCVYIACLACLRRLPHPVHTRPSLS